jgi:hypothetical protein
MQKPGTPFLDVNQALGHQSLQLLVVTARHPNPAKGAIHRGGARFVHWPSNKCAEPSTDTPAALFRRPTAGRCRQPSCGLVSLLGFAQGNHCAAQSQHVLARVHIQPTVSELI